MEGLLSKKGPTRGFVEADKSVPRVLLFIQLVDYNKATEFR